MKKSALKGYEKFHRDKKNLDPEPEGLLRVTVQVVDATTGRAVRGGPTVNRSVETPDELGSILRAVTGVLWKSPGIIPVIELRY